MLTVSKILPFLHIKYKHTSSVGSAYSGNALVSINVVTLRWARSVAGWVIVFGRVNYIGM